MNPEPEDRPKTDLLRKTTKSEDRTTRHRLGTLEGAVVDDRRSFLEAVSAQRPWAHRFSTAMTGSALDGEDLVQEALAQAFFRLADGPVAAAPRGWLLGLAQERLAKLRPKPGRRWRPAAECPRRWFGGAGEAGSRLYALPPRERACVLLKDHLGFGLRELSEILRSPPAAVKAAFYRGRRKLADVVPGLLAPSEAPSRPSEEAVLVRSRLGSLAAAFNARNWAAVLEQLAEDVRLELPGSLVAGKRDMARLYLPGFERTRDWRLLVTPVDGEEVLVRWRESEAGWRPSTAIRITWDGDSAVAFRDYQLVPYLLQGATVGEPDLTSLSSIHLPRSSPIRAARRRPERPPSALEVGRDRPTVLASSRHSPGALLRADAGLL